MRPILCENYELTFVDEERKVILTFALNDIPGEEPAGFSALAQDEDGFEATIHERQGHASEASARVVRFPALPPEVRPLLQAPMVLFVAALREEGVVFANRFEASDDQDGVWLPGA